MARILVVLGMLAGFFVTIIVALLVAVHFIDWNAQRSWVANRLSDALARPVSIERGLDIALFPSPHVVVRDLMVGTSFANAGFELAKIGHRQSFIAQYSYQTRSSGNSDRINGGFFELILQTVNSGIPSPKILGKTELMGQQKKSKDQNVSHNQCG